MEWLPGASPDEDTLVAAAACAGAPGFWLYLFGLIGFLYSNFGLVIVNLVYPITLMILITLITRINLIALITLRNFPYKLVTLR